MADERSDPDQIELIPEGMKVRSGEVMYGNGDVAQVVWLEAEGKRLHHDDERVLVFMFLSPDDAQEHAITIIKEVAMLELQQRLPMIEDPRDG